MQLSLHLKGYMKSLSKLRLLLRELRVLPTANARGAARGFLPSRSERSETNDQLLCVPHCVLRL